MSKHTTSYQMVLRLRKDLNTTTSMLLGKLFSGKLCQDTALTEFPLPTHPFFSTPEWFGLFEDAVVTYRQVGQGQMLVRCIGRTKLFEQDIGLFLRWIQQYLALPALLKRDHRPPIRLAVVDSLPQRQSKITYFLDTLDQITLDYTDPVGDGYQFHLQGRIALP